MRHNLNFSSILPLDKFLRLFFRRREKFAQQQNAPISAYMQTQQLSKATRRWIACYSKLPIWCIDYILRGECCLFHQNYRKFSKTVVSVCRFLRLPTNIWSIASVNVVACPYDDDERWQTETAKTMGLGRWLPRRGWMKRLDEINSAERLGKRFRLVLERLWSCMGQSIPMACQNWCNMKAAYRFFSNPKVNEQDILSGHFEAASPPCRTMFWYYKIRPLIPTRAARVDWINA